MKDMIKTYTLKIYLKSRKKPIVIETDRGDYNEVLIAMLRSDSIIKVGPIIFSIEEFKFATFE